MPQMVSKAALWLVMILSCLAVTAYVGAHAGGDFRSTQTFLYPVEGCDSPCWQGIRPGITDSLEAVDKLRLMPWATGLYAIQGIVSYDSYISWKWNGQQPDIIDAERDGRMWFHNGLVYSIEIPLKIPFATIWGAFGAPEHETTLKSPFKPPQVFYAATYFDETVEFNSIVLCPPNAQNILAARVDVNIAAAHDITDPLPITARLGCADVRR